MVEVVEVCLETCSGKETVSRNVIMRIVVIVPSGRIARFIDFKTLGYAELLWD